jgi:hypothetical protein
MLFRLISGKGMPALAIFIRRVERRSDQARVQGIVPSIFLYGQMGAQTLPDQTYLDQSAAVMADAVIVVTPLAIADFRKTNIS